MPRFTRHKDFQIQVMRDGAVESVINVEEAEIREEVDFERHQFAGDPTYHGDQERKGWTGSMTLRTTDPGADDFIDKVNSDWFDQSGTHEIRIVTTERHAAGNFRSYTYSDVQVKISTQSRMSQALTKTLEFQAGARQAT